MTAKPFFISTPIYYCNDVPHIGHAYTTIAADVLARYHRMMGDPTYFLTGTDEHGQKVEEAAKKSGKLPKEFADGVVEHFKNLWEKLNISNDRFIRTTDEDHKKVVTELWQRMVKAGDIYLGEYEDWYCVPCESFWTEGQLEKGNCCPNPWCNRPVQKRSEKSYFFKLSKFTEPLLEFYEKNPDFVLPGYRLNEVKSFVSQGLNDLSISRTSFKWGIPVPDDDDHVMYVWIDALTNYLTASGFGVDEEKYKTFWPATVHLIGKDILRFHAIFWPAFLMSAGLPLPKHVFAHGFWTVEGQKMSKSLGNWVDPNEMVDLFGLDAFRYFLMREIQLGPDGDFSIKAMSNRINADLANDLGNLLSRSLSMNKKYLKSVVPIKTDGNSSLALECLAAEKEYHKYFGESFLPNKAIMAIWRVISRANKYIDETAPWALAKDPEKSSELSAVMYDLAEVLRRIAIMVYPIMPDSASEMYRQLGLTDEIKGADLAAWGGMQEGSEIARGKSLFPRFDLKEIEKKVAKDKKPAKEKADKKKDKAEAIEGVAFIEFEDFTKLKLKVGLIKEAELVPKTDKLLKLLVDTGEERTIVAGIAAHYKPEELVGKNIIVLTNLKPRKLRGVLSEGMLLAATAKDGKLRVVTTDGEMPAGSRIG